MDNEQELVCALKQIIEIYGVDMLENCDRLRALLKDYLPNKEKDYKLILSALREGVGKTLVKAANQDAETQLQHMKRCTRLLVDDLYITQDAAKFAVNVVALALGFCTDNGDELINDKAENDASSELRDTWRKLNVSSAFASLCLTWTMFKFKHIFSDFQSQTLYDCQSDFNLSEKISKGEIQNPKIIDAFQNETLIGAFDTNDLSGEDSIYVLVDGLLINNLGDDGFIPFSDIREVLISRNGLQIVHYGDGIITTIQRNENVPIGIIKLLRKLLVDVCSKDYFLTEPDVSGTIQNIINQRIYALSTAKAYTSSDFPANEKKLTNALQKYAVRVKRNEVLGFIDTSLFSTGKSGLLFSETGIAFDWAFEKVFLRYEEIEDLRIEHSKLGDNLVFLGHFEEIKNPDSMPSLFGSFYNLDAVQDCLEEICLYF